jgi:pimeloyl-ACP methyl ester carboxylesterase
LFKGYDMKLIPKRKWVIAIGLFLLFFIVIQVGRQFFREQEWQVRHSIYTRIKKAYPQAAKRLEQAHGLKPYKINPDRIGQDLINQDASIVILIHGLDEPGQVWMNLAPVLFEKGFRVLVMTYPNDQPILASTKFVFEQMAAFFKGKKREVTLVAHSMGGLISRDLLTDPKFSYSQKAALGKVPRVKQLIMVGTPNHGSQLAQFRFFLEIRDQFQHLSDDENHWLDGFLDGAGEAGIDLLPGSRFLTQLNSRPLPDHVDFQVIAGMVNPWSEGEISSFIEGLENRLPRETRPALRGLEKILLSMGQTMGDGLVTVDSAKLNGVPLTLVKGTHLTMIRNLSASSKRVPPAVPVIVKMLMP